MFNFLPPLLVGLIATTLMVLNALFWVPILLLVALVDGLSLVDKFPGYQKVADTMRKARQAYADDPPF